MASAWCASGPLVDREGSIEEWCFSSVTHANHEYKGKIIPCRVSGGDNGLHSDHGFRRTPLTSVSCSLAKIPYLLEISLSLFVTCKNHDKYICLSTTLYYKFNYYIDAAATLLVIISYPPFSVFIAPNILDFWTYYHFFPTNLPWPFNTTVGASFAHCTRTVYH